MADAGDVIDNPVTGQRLVFLVTSSDSDGQLFAAEGIFPPGGFAGVPHIHPHQDEHFEVLAGNAAFDIDSRRHVLGAGDIVDVPRGTKHTFANAGEDEMRVRFEFRPALASTARFYELYFAFAQQGRVNAKAMPGLLDLATVWPVTSEHAVLATPPSSHSRRPLSHARARRPNRQTPGTSLPACAGSDRTAPLRPAPTSVTGPVGPTHLPRTERHRMADRRAHLGAVRLPGRGP